MLTASSGNNWKKHWGQSKDKPDYYIMCCASSPIVFLQCYFLSSVTWLSNYKKAAQPFAICLVGTPLNSRFPLESAHLSPPRTACIHLEVISGHLLFTCTQMNAKSSRSLHFCSAILNVLPLFKRISFQHPIGPYGWVGVTYTSPCLLLWPTLWTYGQPTRRWMDRRQSMSPWTFCCPLESTSKWRSHERPRFNISN